MGFKEFQGRLMGTLQRYKEFQGYRWFPGHSRGVFVSSGSFQGFSGAFRRVSGVSGGCSGVPGDFESVPSIHRKFLSNPPDIP